MLSRHFDSADAYNLPKLRKASIALCLPPVLLGVQVTKKSVSTTDPSHSSSIMRSVTPRTFRFMAGATVGTKKPPQQHMFKQWLFLFCVFVNSGGYFNFFICNGKLFQSKGTNAHVGSEGKYNSAALALVWHQMLRNWSLRYYGALLQRL